MTGTTTSGFNWEIQDDTLDDYEMLEILHKIDEGEYGLIPEMVDLFLGEEQRESLKNHIRTKEKKVSASGMLSEVMEIFKSSSQGKNC